MSDVMRSVIDAIIPEGSAWSVAPGEDWDKLYDGIAENWETIRVFLSNLDSTRNPSFTTFLDELEQEFGVLTNPNLTEAQRREYLQPIVYNRNNNGSIDNLQQALDDAGFDVQVHSNDPAVDPNKFLGIVVQFGALEAIFGFPGAVFGGNSQHELLVNGDLFRQTFTFTTVFGSSGSVMGSPQSVFGSHSDLRRELVRYKVPSDPGDWPLVFFVGGDATRDGNGFLTNIDLASVPIGQRDLFRTLILKYKPIHSWAGLIVEYI